jgi:hypothetical protein
MRSIFSNLSLHFDDGTTGGTLAAACDPLFLRFFPTLVAGLGSNFFGFFCG